MLYNIYHIAPVGANIITYGGSYMEFEKIREILVEQFGVDESTITPNTSFVDDLGADSLDVVELIMAIEEAFDMEIPDGEAENIETVKDAVEYLKNYN